MLAVAMLLFVVALGLGVQLVRTNRRLGAATDALAEARRERDDALEQADRARRDAADIAEQMEQEAAARAAAEVALAEAEAVASGDEQQAAELWALALASVRRTWEVSVAPSPDLGSPLDDSDDELRDAIGIEVDAAREEAGAAIDLEWSGGVVVEPALAVRTLALAQEVIGRLAKAADAAVLQVTVVRDTVTLEVTGTDVEGRPAPFDRLLADVATEHQVAPGRFELAGRDRV